MLLDRIDPRDYKVDDLRRQFAIVLQEPVFDNDRIAYGGPDATLEQIISAAKAANRSRVHHPAFRELP